MMLESEPVVRLVLRCEGACFRLVVSGGNVRDTWRWDDLLWDDLLCGTVQGRSRGVVSQRGDMGMGITGAGRVPVATVLKPCVFLRKNPVERCLLRE